MTPQQIIETIRREPKVPAPSRTVHRILDMTKDPECDVNLVADLIGQDSSLTAQLLRQANSVLYGFSSPTSSVSAASKRLGLKRVRSAVVNQHVVSGLGKALPPGFDAHRYWQATLATSVAAQDLCRQLLPELADDAGTAGLLCDIGVGLMAFGVPEAYRQVLSQSSSGPAPSLHRLERRLLGVTHAEVGAAVLADWKIDQHIISAVRNHHAEPVAAGDGGSAEGGPDLRSRGNGSHGEEEHPPGQGGKLLSFDRIIGAAVTLSRIALDGSDMENVATLFAQMGAITSNADDLVARLFDQLVGHIQETAESLAVVLGPVGQMQANFDEVIRGLPNICRR